MTTVQEHAPPRRVKKARNPRPSAPVPTDRPEGILLVEDVARILGVTPGTVLSNLKHSKPMVGKKPGRYANHPFPAPRRMAPATTLWWPASAAEEIRAWDKGRLTQSHGKGRQAFGPRGPRKGSQ